MFTQNKYTECYYRIINRAKSRKIDAYTENHHILPKSLGGSNKKDNLVKLTAKEHFVCHRLLVKMTCGDSKRKMSYALWLICNMKNQTQQRYVVNSIAYAQIRENHSAMLSETKLGVKKTYSSFKGKKHSIETLEHLKKVKVGKNNPNYGITQLPEWNKAKSDAQIGIPKPVLVCENCNQTVGGHGNYKRWHGVNCKKTKALVLI